MRCFWVVLESGNLEDLDCLESQEYLITLTSFKPFGKSQKELAQVLGLTLVAKEVLSGLIPQSISCGRGMWTFEV